MVLWGKGAAQHTWYSDPLWGWGPPYADHSRSLWRRHRSLYLSGYEPQRLRHNIRRGVHWRCQFNRFWQWKFSFQLKTWSYATSSKENDFCFPDNRSIISKDRSDHSCDSAIIGSCSAGSQSNLVSLQTWWNHFCLLSSCFYKGTAKYRRIRRAGGGSGVQSPRGAPAAG